MSLPRLTIAAAGVALLVLVGYGTCPWADRPGGAPTGEPSPSEPLQDATASRAAALEARLAREAAARIQLERQVARLDERVSMLAKRLGEQPASPARPGARNQDAPREAENASARPAGPENFDGAVLLDAGFSASEAAELRARVDGITMSSLALWDRATREGWVGTPRFEEEAAAVAHGAQLEALRSDVGDEAFDWALFAAGHDHRIRVESVLAGSPAAMGGDSSGRPGGRIRQRAHVHRRTARRGHHRGQGRRSRRGRSPARGRAACRLPAARPARAPDRRDAGATAAGPLRRPTAPEVHRSAAPG